MKAIILIAALVLFAQASNLNFTAYHLGFTEQLGLDPSQLQDASACFGAVKTVVRQAEDIIQAVRYEQAERAIVAISELITEVETKLAGECAAYRVDLITLLTQNGTDVKALAKKNFYTYPTQVIQQASFWIQQFLSGQEYEAGKTEAYILQILFGLEQPEELVMPTFNNSNYVPMDLNKAFTEYYQSYLAALGFTDETKIDTLTRCQVAYMNATTALATLSYSMNNGTLVKVQAISKMVALAAETVEVCAGAWKIGKPIAKEAWDVYTFWPVLNTIQVVLNLGQNLPEIVQRMGTAAVDMMEGRYSDAGVIQAENYQTMLNQVMNLTAIIQHH
jgi:hypothetical protein